MANNDTDKAQTDAVEAGAGVPAGPMREAAEQLPEKDAVQVATKDAMLADTTQEEAKAKVRVVRASPDSADTPSGAALLKTAGIADPVKRGNAYTAEKAAKRFGYVRAE